MAAARSLIAIALAVLLSSCGSKATTDTEAADTAEAKAASEGPKHEPKVAAAIEQGHDLFFGKAMCSTCHKVYTEGAMIVGPNLGVGEDIEEPFAVRVDSRGPDIDPPSYVIDSILDPNAIVVPSYARSVMKSPDDIPVALSDDELVALAAFILSVGASEAIDPAALDRARARIPVARENRKAASN